MNMVEWARKEVEIACKKEAPDRKDGEWDYGCSCYESALKAFESLVEDGHSGLSIQFTKVILNKLIDGEPLTPIEDTDDIWKPVYGESGKHYQCKRMSRLFKDVDKNGKVTYSDVDRVYCERIGEPSNTFTSGTSDRLIDRLYPITMPYTGRDKFKFLVDELEPELGCFSGIAFIKLYKNDERVEDFKPVYILYTDKGDEEISKEKWEELRHECDNGRK